MNTEQKYVGRGNNAPETSPAAQNQAQPSPQQDEWHFDSIEERILKSGNQILIYALKLSKNPSVTSIKTGIALSAIGHAFRLGAPLATSKPATSTSDTTIPEGVDPNVWAAQTDLLELVDDFATTHALRYLTPTLNKLLEKWLTTPAIDLSSFENQHELRRILDVINFLSVLVEQSETLNWYINEAKAEGGQEV